MDPRHPGLKYIDFVKLFLAATILKGHLCFTSIFDGNMLVSYSRIFYGDCKIAYNENILKINRCNIRRNTRLFERSGGY